LIASEIEHFNIYLHTYMLVFVFSLVFFIWEAFNQIVNHKIQIRKLWRYERGNQRL